MIDGADNNSFQVERTLQCDVVVIGGGPAGIAAASAAAEREKHVVLVDANPGLGGQIWRTGPADEASPVARSWRKRLQASGTEILSGMTAFGAVEGSRLLCVKGDSPRPSFARCPAETKIGTVPASGVEIRADKIILATGARELLLPFPGWTLPGVFGAGGLDALAKGGWPVKGKRVVLAGSGPLLLAAAAGLTRHGAKIVSIAEQTPWSRIFPFGLSLVGRPGKLFEGLRIKLRLLTVPYRCGCWPVCADGGDRVETVTLTDGRRQWTEQCDYLACGFGLVPNVEIAQLLGCRLHDGFVAVDRRQETSVPGVFCAGEPTGIGGVDCALVEGQIAGLCAAGYSGPAEAFFNRRDSWHRFRDELAKAFALRGELKRLAAPDTVVCRCEDVGREQLEPYASFRAAKLHTRCGMGPCQGRVCGAATAFLRGWENDSVRPPVFPVPVAALAGQPAAEQDSGPGTLENGNLPV